MDLDELLDILDAHEVKQLPNQSNIDRLVHEIAHKEQIQAPMFVADFWHDVLTEIRLKEDQLMSIYSELKPTSRAICKSPSFPDSMTAEETNVCNHLTRLLYIQSIQLQQSVNSLKEK